MSTAELSPAPSSSLFEAIRDSVENNRFFPDRFFQKWFRDLGTAYFFLFKKNLSVTNIAHAELMSLLREHVRSRTVRARDFALAFHTTSAFTTTIETIVRPVTESIRFSPATLRDIAALYWPIVENSVVVDQFFTSCAVFLPPHLHLDLLSVCGQSGYIHSCGYSLFVRRVDKSNQLDFYAAIDRHLARYPAFSGKLQFLPFTIEDFGHGAEADFVKDALSDGIGEVRMRVEKMHMDNLSLVEIFQDMSHRYSGRLLFRPSGDYHTQHPKSSDSTLWLLVDHGTNPSTPTARGPKRYYISYHQLYINDSPFHAFDENKPAWIAHNTIPHTLVGAMINITKPWPSGRTMVIADPFAGTGTTWLETLNHQHSRCMASDRSRMLHRLFADNLAFFTLRPIQIAELSIALNLLVAELAECKRSYDSNPSEQPLLIEVPNLLLPQPYRRAMTLIKELCGSITGIVLSFEFTDSVVQKLSACTFFDRIVFYIALRAELRYQLAYARESRDHIDAFIESAKYLVGEIAEFATRSLRVKEEKSTCGPFSVFTGHYSDACGIRPAQLEKTMGDFANLLTGTVRIADARTLSPESCDIVLTDPPYGVNTEEDSRELARLYAEVFGVIVAAVNSGGHIVVCLPAESHSGRRLPSCTVSQLVTAQVLRSADALHREIFLPARSSLPMTTPPYYWKSSALSRRILHFRVRDLE